MSSSRRIPLILLLLLLATISRTSTAQSLADTLYLRFLPPNEAARSLTPPSITNGETPIVVRYTLIAGIAVYEARAACHPTALSFFGVRDTVPAQFCTPDNNAILLSYTVYAAVVNEFGPEVQPYADFLRRQGLEPVSSSTDRATLNGWANFAGNRLANYFANDGWNSLGNINRQFNRVRFEDYTGYRPANNPYAPPVRLYRPLRWQPQAIELDSPGRLVHQIHVVPHIGVRVTPLVLPREESQKRRPTPPYRRPNAALRIRMADRKAIRAGLREVLGISARLTGMQRFLALWWDNKLVSTAGISAFYEFDNELTPFEAAQQFMGEMLAQHDALLTAWREKRRNDLARPRALLQNLRPGMRVSAFVDESVGVQSVRVEDWRPFLAEQPHSEFPSNSAALCYAAMEHIQEYHRIVKGRLNTIKIRYPAGTLPFPTREDMTVAFESPLAAADVCGESRLWGGVHFRPAVDAGKSIGKGIGKIALEHILELGMGRVPEGCERCEMHRMRLQMAMGNATMHPADRLRSDEM